MTKLTADDVRHLARLVRIAIDDQDIPRFQRDLNAILTYVEQLNEIDTAGVEPTAQVTGLTNVEREDQEVTDGLTPAELLDQVPQVDSGQIKVPKVL